MEVHNAREASLYLDALVDAQERSAVIAIHLTWLDHCSSLANAPRLSSDSPLDMLILYRAMGNTFRESFDDSSSLQLTSAENIVNRQPHLLRLKSVANDESVRYAYCFLAEANRLASDANNEQDLLFYLDLFIACLGRCSIADIISGEISRTSQRLADPDYW